MKRFNLLAICGPTASGKTSLAVAVAHMINGEIISADSRQVYKGLDIGSGKDLHEYAVGGRPVLFHLIDIVSPTDTYTISHFQKDFHRVFSAVRNHGSLPILCGGSGLYIESVLRDYQIPDVPENPDLRLELTLKDKKTLEQQLYRLDPQRHSHTDLSSKKRIIRAIEIATYPRSNNHTRCNTEKNSDLVPVVLCTRFTRPVLHQRITERLYQRIDEGMIAEVYHLRKNGLDDERLMMLGMEYRHITRYLRRELSLSEMIDTLRTEIYRLAKRQESYFRGMERRCNIPFHWIDNADKKTALQTVRTIFAIE